MVTDTNSGQWVTDLQALPTWGMIQWPAELAYTTGGQIIMMMGITDVDFGAADIEGRVEGSMSIQPKGTPYVNAGSHP